MPKLLILSDEFIARLHVGLGEIQAKFAIPVIQDIQAQVDLSEKDAAAFLASVEAHVSPFKQKVAAAEAGALRLAKEAETAVAGPLHAIESFVEKVL
jgi:hypothetical protein